MKKLVIDIKNNTIENKELSYEEIINIKNNNVKVEDENGISIQKRLDVLEESLLFMMAGETNV